MKATRTWTDREGPVHLEVLRHLRLRFPRAVIHHSPNGSSLRGPAVARSIAKAKHLGMVKGFPDLIVLHEGEAMCFEVKHEGGRVEPEQAALHEALRATGINVAVVRSVQDVDEALDHWFGDLPDAWQSVGDVVTTIQKKMARQRANAPGPALISEDKA